MYVTLLKWNLLGLALGLKLFLLLKNQCQNFLETDTAKHASGTWSASESHHKTVLYDENHQTDNEEIIQIS